MIADLKPYSAYADSGQDWLGSVPAHWSALRAKCLFREVDERSTTGKEELLSVSHLTGVTPRRLKTVTMFLAESNVGHKVCRPGDLVINTLWAWMAALGVTRHTGIVSPAYGVYRPIDGSGILPAYADHLLRTPLYAAEYQRRSTGVNSSRLRLYPEQFLRVPVLVPPLAEQVAIVRFLEWANGRLERAIRAKRKVIALLTEQRQVVIHRVVSRGIDPVAPSKPSGVPWLGDIPAHWHLRRLKQVCRFVYGDSLPDAARRLGQVSVRGSNSHVGTHDVANTQSPCIVIGRKGSFGKVNYCPEAVFAIDTTFYLDSRHTNADLQWLAHLLTIMWLDTVSKDAAVPGLSRDDAYSQFVPFPPSRSEQAELANLLKRELNQFDGLSTRFNREIELLREYRTRLVSDVVTGKLDVREAAPRFPDEATLDIADEPMDETDDAELTDEEAAA